MQIDPIRLEVLKNAFDSIADVLALMLMRTAQSPIVRDSMDFSTAICDRAGQTLAQGLTTPIHLGSFHDAMQFLIARFADDIRPGDVFIGNDPYAAAGQHLPDIYVVEPIFHIGSQVERPSLQRTEGEGDSKRRGETSPPPFLPLLPSSVVHSVRGESRRDQQSAPVLIGWATTVAHHADVGGIVPGSNALSANEIYQEGLRLPFLKLLDGGRPNQAIWDIIALNVRVPDQVLGDLNAQRAACLAGARGYRDLFARHGVAEMYRYIDALHDYAERLTRAEIARIPDGTWHFTDHIDGLGESPEPVIFQLALTVDGDRVITDWTGSSPQVRGGINTPLPFTKAGVYAALRSVMHADIPNCHGFTRAIEVRAPLGTVVNSVHPAPTGARGITGYRVIDCMFGALAQVLPERVTADGTGGSTIPTFGGWHDGAPFVFAETFMGTWGAAAAHDGQEGVPHLGANQSNVPVEMIEANYPLRILRYGIVPDTGGAGQYRGGNALTRVYQLLADRCVFSLRSDKRAFPPHGLAGGGSGSGPVNLINPGRSERVLPVLVTEAVELECGDVFFHVTPSGGGYGDPLQRDPARVLADVREEKLSVARARDAYGVVIANDPPALDIAATRDLRKRLITAREAQPG